MQGLGFVGALMAAVAADCEIEGKAPYFVMGVDLPSVGSFWKIPTLNRGESPFKAEDPEVDEIFRRVIKLKNNFRATWVPEAYSEADIIIVDINLDVIKPEIGRAERAQVEILSFKNAVEEIGKRMRTEALLLIETTVPPGTVENIVMPAIEKCFADRGIEPTKNYPLWELQRPAASELAKILENSYRAMNIAFIYEWTLFAEDVGINLFDVIDSIRVRKGTHDNMMYPGFGVGGYCLTKDPILAEWASKNICKNDKTKKWCLIWK